MIPLRFGGLKRPREEVLRDTPTRGELHVDFLGGALHAHITFPWVGAASQGTSLPRLSPCALQSLRGADLVLVGEEMVGPMFAAQRLPQAWWCRLVGAGDDLVRTPGRGMHRPAFEAAYSVTPLRAGGVRRCVEDLEGTEPVRGRLQVQHDLHLGGVLLAQLDRHWTGPASLEPRPMQLQACALESVHGPHLVLVGEEEVGWPHEVVRQRQAWRCRLAHDGDGEGFSPSHAPRAEVVA